MDAPAPHRVTLERLEAEGFRNLGPTVLSFHPRFNLFTGGNAQGKTNCLEAAAVLLELRSFRGASPGEMTAHGAGRARLRGRAYSGALDYDLALELSADGRRLWVNGKAARTAREHQGRLPTVAFTPEDVRLARGEPQGRRRFLDRALCLVRPDHLRLLSEYRQVLARRNFLLRTRRADEPLFLVYTGRLAELGWAVAQGRAAFADELDGLAAAAARAVSGDGETLSLRYRFSLPEGERGGEALAALLARTREEDLRRGFTGAGPHAEDLEILLDGRPAGVYGSQGQQRTAALALKVAEVEAVRAISGTYPLLLIDDLSSELDDGRRERLFDHLAGAGGQALLTATDPHLGARLGPAGLARFSVEAGVVRPLE